MQKEIDYAKIEVKCAELCILQDELKAAMGTANEPAAKAVLTAAVKELNKWL